MHYRTNVAAVAVAGVLGMGTFVGSPGTAQAADPCVLGSTNAGPRSCVTTDFGLSPVLTIGNGICAGVLTAAGNGFDGPLAEYTEAPGAVHSVVLRIAQGISPLGTWAPTVFACDVNAVFDWQNLDSGRAGSQTRFIPAGQSSSSRTILVADTGPGRVRLTLRTDRPNIPASAEITVP